LPEAAAAPAAAAEAHAVAAASAVVGVFARVLHQASVAHRPASIAAGPASVAPAGPELRNFRLVEGRARPPAPGRAAVVGLLKAVERPRNFRLEEGRVRLRAPARERAAAIRLRKVAEGPGSFLPVQTADVHRSFPPAERTSVRATVGATGSTTETSTPETLMSVSTMGGGMAGEVGLIIRLVLVW